MRISDWSSDVCSSDLPKPGAAITVHSNWEILSMRILKSIFALLLTLSFAHALPAQAGTVKAFVGQYSGAIGDLSVSDPKKAGKLTANTLVRVGGNWRVDRKSVVEGKSVSVGVDLGGRRII